MPALVVRAEHPIDAGLELAHPELEPALLLAQRAALLGQRLEPALLRDSLRLLALQPDAAAIGLIEVPGLDQQLLDPLLVEVSVGDHLLHLPVEQLEHLRVLDAERAGAGGTVALGSRLHDALALVLELLVLVEQPLALGPGVLRVAHPGGAHRLAVERYGRDGGADVAHPLARGVELGARRHPRQALLDRGQVAADVVELREQAFPRRVRLGFPLEGRDLVAERGQRGQPQPHLFQLRARGRRFRHLAFEPLDPLGGGGPLVVGDAQLGLEGQRGLAEPLELLPPRPHFGQPALRRRRRGGGGALRRAGRCHALVGTGLGRLDLGQIDQPGAERVVAGAERRPPLLEPVLRGPDPLVPEDAREELRALGRGHRRHDGELLLPGEVGVEELVARHAEETGDALGDGADRVGDRRRIAVLVELGAVQGAQDAILVGAEGELELDLHPRARRRAATADGLPAAARRRHAVHRPGDGLEQRGLAGAVGADDAREARAELEIGVLVLAEIAEPQPVDLHQAPARSRSTASIRDSPRRTNASRSSSAGRGRRSR